MDPIEVLLKEYETLRQEILTAMSSRNSILSFGLAAVGTILTASLLAYTTDGYSLLSSLLLMLPTPTITCFVIFMWLGEYQRMQRAGKFLVNLEVRINEKAGEELLTWETNLRANKGHMKYPYNTTVLLLTIISTFSLIAGAITLEISVKATWATALAGIILHLVIFGFAATRIRELRR